MVVKTLELTNLRRNPPSFPGSMQPILFCHSVSLFTLNTVLKTDFIGIGFFVLLAHMCCPGLFSFILNRRMTFQMWNFLSRKVLRVFHLIRHLGFLQACKIRKYSRTKWKLRFFFFLYHQLSLPSKLWLYEGQLFSSCWAFGVGRRRGSFHSPSASNQITLWSWCKNNHSVKHRVCSCGSPFILFQFSPVFL